MKDNSNIQTQLLFTTIVSAALGFLATSVLLVILIRWKYSPVDVYYRVGELQAVVIEGDTTLREKLKTTDGKLDRAIELLKQLSRQQGEVVGEQLKMAEELGIGGKDVEICVPENEEKIKLTDGVDIWGAQRCQSMS